MRQNESGQGTAWVILLDWSAEGIRETPAQSDRATLQQVFKTVYLIPRQTPEQE
jgi:hypothetical protein